MKKKIIITGGLGYIGTEICKLYSGVSWHHNIVVIDNRFISERVNQIRSWNIEFVQGDILDQELIKKYCTEADIIHHLAGITDVPRTKSESSSAKDEKIKEVAEKGTQNILDMADGDAKDKRNEKIILNGMARDNFQRENLANGIKEAEENDLIIISDLDEIPNLNKLETSDVKNNIIIFEQKMFYYKFNLFYENYTWFGSKAIRNKQFKSPQ